MNNWQSLDSGEKFTSEELRFHLGLTIEENSATHQSIALVILHGSQANILFST